MRNKRGLELFTIGYSSFALNKLISVLKRYSIQVVVDVRSQPSPINNKLKEMLVQMAGTENHK